MQNKVLIEQLLQNLRARKTSCIHFNLNIINSLINFDITQE